MLTILNLITDFTQLQGLAMEMVSVSVGVALLAGTAFIVAQLPAIIRILAKAARPLWLLTNALIRHFHFRNNRRLAFDELYHLSAAQLRTLHAVWYGRRPYELLPLFRLWQLGLVMTPIPIWSQGREVGARSFAVRDFLDLSRVDDYTLGCRYHTSRATAAWLSRESGKSQLSANYKISQEMLEDLRYQTWLCSLNGPLRREAARRGIQLETDALDA